MRKHHYVIRLALLAAALGLLAGCVAAPAASPSTTAPATAVATAATTTPPPAGTDPTPAGSGVIVSTSSPGVSSGPLPTSTATAAAPLPPLTTGSTPRTVTTADHGRTIEMRVGERFLLNLGEGAVWVIEIADPQVLGAVTGVEVPEGAQGLFEALAAGATTLAATNEPACLKARPACKLPTRTFEVTVVVK